MPEYICSTKSAIMIDLHCHILPDVDDGAATLGESCCMARLAASDGMKTIVATPHTCDGLYRNNREDIVAKVSALNAELTRADIPLQVLAGDEVRLTTGVTDKLRRGEASTINKSRYILLALPKIFHAETVKDEIFALRMNGYVPILAGPERSPGLQRDFDCLKELVGLGVFCQITAASLTGGFGREVKFVAEKMVLQGLAHVIASDSHASSWREPILSAAVKKAARILGDEAQARRLVSDLPEAIIGDRDVAMEIPSRDKVQPSDEKGNRPGPKKHFRYFS